MNPYKNNNTTAACNAWPITLKLLGQLSNDNINSLVSSIVSSRISGIKNQDALRQLTLVIWMQCNKKKLQSRIPSLWPWDTRLKKYEVGVFTNLYYISIHYCSKLSAFSSVNVHHSSLFPSPSFFHLGCCSLKHYYHYSK